MEYWGAEVKSGEQLKVVPGEGRIMVISQVCLGEPIKKNICQFVDLFVEYDEVKSVLGTLYPDKVPQQIYDFAFDGDFILSHNWKYGSVCFSGYKLHRWGSAAGKPEVKIVEPNKEDKAEDAEGPMREDEKAALMNGEDENGEEALKKAIDASLIACRRPVRMKSEGALKKALNASLIALFIDNDTIQILAERVDDAELSLIANGILNLLRYNPGSDTKEVFERVARFWKNKAFIKELHHAVVVENMFLIFDLWEHTHVFIEEPVEDRVSRIKKDYLFKEVLEEQESVGKMRGIISILLGYWLSEDVLSELYKAMGGFDFPGSTKLMLSCWKK